MFPCPFQLMGNLKLITMYYALLQCVEICLEGPSRKKTMHNVVIEVGIDFKNFSKDLNVTKQHDIK